MTRLQPGPWQGTETCAISVFCKNGVTGPPYAVVRIERVSHVCVRDGCLPRRVLGALHLSQRAFTWCLMVVSSQDSACSPQFLQVL